MSSLVPSVISPGGRIVLDFPGQNSSLATIEEFDGTVLTVSVDGDSSTFIVDLDRNVVFDKHGNQGQFVIAPPQRGFIELMSDPFVSEADLNRHVWQRIRGSVPECTCPRCLLSQVAFLEEAARHPPPSDNVDIPLICVYIRDTMIPRMMHRVSDNIADLIQQLQDGPASILAQVLQASMQDGPKRHAAKSEVVASLAEFAHPFDSSHKCDTCTICMEKFTDIAGETGVPVTVITCPGCESSFCAGDVSQGERKEDQCQGFKYLMEKYDNRCPICRMEVKDWEKSSAAKETTLTEETPIAETSDAASEESSPILPRYNYDDMMEPDSWGSVDDPEDVIYRPRPGNRTIFTFPEIEVLVKRSHRRRRRGQRNKYPPRKVKPTSLNSYGKRRQVMRHKRQLNGVSNHQRYRR